MKITAIIISSILISCSGSYNIDELYIQKIPDSPNVIYRYYGTVGNSEFRGYSILDSTEKLIISNSTKKLPITIFNKVPNKNMIDVTYLEWPKERNVNPTLLVQENPSDVNGIECKVVKYEQTYGSKSDCSLVRYGFKSFTESSDSLTLYGITKIWKSNPDLPENVSFQKGNIKIIEGRRKQVVRLEIEELILYNAEGCTKTYYFEPKTNINTNGFSSFGIFKKIPRPNWGDTTQ